MATNKKINNRKNSLLLFVVFAAVHKARPEAFREVQRETSRVVDGNAPHWLRVATALLDLRQEWRALSSATADPTKRDNTHAEMKQGDNQP